MSDYVQQKNFIQTLIFLLSVSIRYNAIQDFNVDWKADSSPFSLTQPAHVTC